MNIYKVELPHNIYLGKKTFYEFVVISKTEDDARNTHPSGRPREWVKQCDIHKLVVTKIGKADEKYKENVIICTSFLDE